MDVIRPKNAHWSCIFLPGLSLSSGPRAAARLYLHECTRRTACSQKGGLGSGNQVAEVNWDRKSNSQLPFSAASQFCLTELKRLLFLSKVSAIEKSLSGKGSLFPFFLLSDDKSEAPSIGGVGEPYKYKLKCSYISFPWNTVNSCKFCNMSSWVRDRGEQWAMQEVISGIAWEAPGNFKQFFFLLPFDCTTLNITDLLGVIMLEWHLGCPSRDLTCSGCSVLWGCHGHQALPSWDALHISAPRIFISWKSSFRAQNES